MLLKTLCPISRHPCAMCFVTGPLPLINTVQALKCRCRLTTGRSGYCYLNKGEYNLNQSKDDSFVERVVKNNSCNNGDRHKIHEIVLNNCFVFCYNSSLENSTEFGIDAN